MASGKVKWFNNAKGYGFILSETGDEDLFVHYSSIQMDGYRTLKAGQPVEFDVHEGPKGFHAVNIRASEEEETEAAPTADVADAEQPAAQVELDEAPGIQPEALHS